MLLKKRIWCPREVKENSTGLRGRLREKRVERDPSLVDYSRGTYVLRSGTLENKSLCSLH
jgi:hypothetical protein